jgi:hypothetical protein
LTGSLSVRPHLVLAVAVPRLPYVRCQLEPERRRNPVQDLRRKRPAKTEQHASFVEIDLRRHMRERGSDRSNAPAQPTYSAGQADVGSTKRIGSYLHALRRRRYGDAVVDRSE